LHIVSIFPQVYLNQSWANGPRSGPSCGARFWNLKPAKTAEIQPDRGSQESKGKTRGKTHGKYIYGNVWKYMVLYGNIWNILYEWMFYHVLSIFNLYILYYIYTRICSVRGKSMKIIDEESMVDFQLPCLST
jgi:hypothetical protein